MLDIAETIVASALQRKESRGAHQRTDFPAARRRASSWRTRSPNARPTARAAFEYLPVTITRWPPAERVYGEAAPDDGAEDDAHITLRVARYRPEQESETTFEEYEVPCPRDWVVLDGLNHIKDQIDGTLSFRWSCRMGICGSCGMLVNGEPKLTCATFLSDYAPGPIRVEPLRNFPVIRDLIVELGDFMGKLTRVKPGSSEEVEKPALRGGVPADARRTGGL